MTDPFNHLNTAACEDVFIAPSAMEKHMTEDEKDTKIEELLSKGYSQNEIVQIVGGFKE